MVLKIPRPELRPDESLVNEGPANLQRGVETVGGALFLTDQRLIFSSHRFNVQSGPTEIELDAVTAATPCWTRFLGLVPLFPNSLAVVANGTEYRFVVNGRRRWKQLIDEAAARRR